MIHEISRVRYKLSEHNLNKKSLAEKQDVWMEIGCVVSVLEVRAGS